jgi:hypothetical protein
MEGIERELSDLREYLEELRSERAAAKDKEKRDGWTKYTAVSVVFIAVLAAVAAQWAGKYSTGTLKALNDSTYYQAKASDQWSYYQAKSIKQSLYEIARDEDAPTENAAAGKRNETQARVARYEQEKNQIKEAATGLEAQRDRARDDATKTSSKGAGLGLSIAVFQIAIAIASISMIVKKKPFWYASLALGLIATAQMLHVFIVG